MTFGHDGRGFKRKSESRIHWLTLASLSHLGIRSIGHDRARVQISVNESFSLGLKDLGWRCEINGSEMPSSLRLAHQSDLVGLFDGVKQLVVRAHHSDAIVQLLRVAVALEDIQIYERIRIRIAS